MINLEVDNKPISRDHNNELFYQIFGNANSVRTNGFFPYNFFTNANIGYLEINPDKQNSFCNRDFTVVNLRDCEIHHLVINASIGDLIINGGNVDYIDINNKVKDLIVNYEKLGTVSGIENVEQFSLNY